MKDYYSLLGLESTATKKEIKKNYRKLASKYHPDKNNDPNSAGKFIVITEAYDVLSNRKSRTQYDLMRWEMLNRKEGNSATFTTQAPPRESTRTRRSMAQHKRSEKYHQTKTQTKKLWLLISESSRIISRYSPHMIGIILMAIILSSAVSQLSDIFNSGIGRGIGVSIFIVALIYGIFKIAQITYQEFGKDIEAFSIFYKVSQRKGAIYTLSLVVVVLLLICYFYQPLGN